MPPGAARSGAAGRSSTDTSRPSASTAARGPIATMTMERAGRRVRPRDHARPGIARRVVRDPVVRDPVVRDPVVRDPVVRDPVVRDPVVREPVVRDPDRSADHQPSLDRRTATDGRPVRPSDRGRSGIRGIDPS
jgi:hypothetical protein